MRDLFHREQKILDDALKYIGELRSGAAFDCDVFEAFVKEYGTMLKHLRKVLKISDKASVILFNDQKFRQEKITELENELLQNQISLMLSQIRPHFLYNSLVAIQELCLIDPEVASEAVSEFSTYLRGNIDSLSIKNPVPFEKELRHVETYLSLEKRRFGKKLNVVYDISARDFFLPALTLQPVVENAVRHGVTKREEGGTVTIRSEGRETQIVITVIDDGVGFNADGNYGQGDRLHVGIDNVRSRLASMCRGTLSIESKQGTGTTVVITIPRGEPV
jgi:sensor histidine kinase YesM